MAAAKPKASPLEKKVLTKAASPDAILDDIVKILSKDESTATPQGRATFLADLLEKGALDIKHAAAIDALAHAFLVPGVSLETVKPHAVLTLLQKTTAFARGVDSLTMLVFSRDPAVFLEARGALSEPARHLLDLVRLRHGEALTGDVAAVIALVVEVDGLVQRTPEGLLRPGSIAERLELLSRLGPPEQWTPAIVARFAKPGGYGFGGEWLSQLPEAAIVQILAGKDHAREPSVWKGLMTLTLRAQPLWDAMAAVAPTVHQNSFHAATYFTMSLLAVVAALASKREGGDVPAAFETHFSAVATGYPNAPNEALAPFLVSGLAPLGTARLSALVDRSFALDDERAGRKLNARFLSDAVLAAVASGDSALREKVRARTSVAPMHTVPASILAVL